MVEYEQLSQHVGHELTVGIVEGAPPGEPIGMSIQCMKCEVVLETAMKTMAEGGFTKKLDGRELDEWAIKVENGDELAPGSIVKVIVRKTGEEKQVRIGEKIGDIGGKYPGRVYKNEGEV